MTPSEYEALPQEDRDEIEGTMLYGPSPLRQVILIGQIKNMLESYFTQKRVRSDSMPWLDGLMANPEILRESREEDRKEAAISHHLAIANQARRAEKK